VDILPAAGGVSRLPATVDVRLAEGQGRSTGAVGESHYNLSIALCHSNMHTEVVPIRRRHAVRDSGGVDGRVQAPHTTLLPSNRGTCIRINESFVLAVIPHIHVT